MNIDQYYQQGGRGGAQQGFGGVRAGNTINAAPPPTPGYSPTPQSLYPQMSASVTATQRNQYDPATATGYEDEYRAMWAARNAPNPQLEGQSEDVRRRIQEIYMRYAQAGEYGSVAMNEEVNDVLRQAANAPQSAPAPTNTEPPPPTFNANLYKSFIQSGAWRPDSAYYRRPWEQWLPNYAASGSTKQLPPRGIPVRGGPGGLPGPR